MKAGRLNVCLSFKEFCQKGEQSNATGLGNKWGVKWSFAFERWELYYKRALMRKIKQKESADATGQGGGNHLVNGLLGSTERSWSFVWINLRGSQSAWLASQLQLLGCTELAEKFNQAEVFWGDYNGDRWENSGNNVRLYFFGSKISADGDCSHEIKRHLLLRRKVISNLDSIFKSRDITLPTKVRLVKAMVFPVVMYGCEN